METTVLEQYKEHITDWIQLGIYNKFNKEKQDKIGALGTKLIFISYSLSS